MGISTVTRNYQVTLPRDVRELEDIEIGDRVLITVEDDEIMIKKIDTKALEDSFGAWKSRGGGVEFVRGGRDESEESLKELGL